MRNQNRPPRNPAHSSNASTPKTLLWLLGVGAVLTALAHAGGSSTDDVLRQRFGPVYKRPSEIPYAADNAFSEEKYELGRTLFFDQRLSRAGNQSCASCHHAGLGWEMGLPKALGAAEMPRKSQTLLNLAWSDTWFWDGRADSFSSQFHIALNSPKALAMTDADLVARLRAVPGYAPLFTRAFTSPEISIAKIGQALEIFERGIVAGPAPFDRWFDGDDHALSIEAKRGAALFLGKANCAACHSGWNFTDNGFHDVGLSDGDLGRGKTIPLPALQHAFKTPTLRSVAQRAPFMHDGELATLEDVVRHYDRGGATLRPSLAPELKPLHLEPRETKELIEFLRTLTGVDKPVVIPMMPM